MNTVVNGFELGGFIHNVLRRCDFAAVMEPGRDKQLLSIVFGQLEPSKWAVTGRMSRFRQHLGNGGYSNTMPPSVRRFSVQRRRDQFDKRLIDLLEFIHEDRIVQQNAREPCQRLKQRRHLIWKRHHLAGAFLKVIEQLQHADNSALMIL